MHALSRAAARLRPLGPLAILLVIASAFSPLALRSYGTGLQDFILHNRTGSHVYEVYVSPSSSDDWEEDVMGSDVLLKGESVEITFDDGEKATRWDLKVVTESEAEHVWTELDLSVVSEVTIHHRNGRAWATTK